MATLSNGIPEGNKAPLLKLDDAHHGSWLVICCAFGIAIIILTLIIRIYLRYKVSPPFAADDIAATVSTALAVIQCALVFAGVNRGDGTSINLIDENDLIPIQKLNYASNVFYVLTLYASKICVVLLFKRISSGIVHKKIAWVALGVTATFGIISIFLVALRCDLSKPWILFGAKCTSLFAHWQVIAALDITTEVGLFGMAVHMVWGLQTAMSNKSRVVFAFGLRLPVIVVAGLHVHYLANKLHSPNPTLIGVIPAICRQTELFYAIMASTIPCLRPFLASFFTGFGAMGGETIIAGSQVGNSSREKDYALDSMNSAASSAAARKSKRRSRRSVDGRERDNFGGDRQNRAQVSHEATASSGSRRTVAADASSVASNESQRMIIKKEVQWCVDSERGEDVGRGL